MKVAEIALLLLLAPSTSIAQEEPCLTPNDVAQRLVFNYGGRLVHQAITEHGWLLEVNLSPTGTWTQVIFTPDGVCMRFALSGTAWTTDSGLDGKRL